MATLKIDDKSFNVEDLPEDVRSQLEMLRAADARILELKRETALIQTARNVFARAVADAVTRGDAASLS